MWNKSCCALLTICCIACYPSRVVLWNFADQKDQYRFPYHEIEPSESPFFFESDENRMLFWIDYPNQNGWKNISLQYVLETNENNLAFLIIKSDTLLFEHYGSSITDSTRLMSFSVSKSIIGSLIGIAFEEGLLDLKDPITNYIDELQSSFSDITIQHLLEHTSGIRFNENYTNPFANHVAKFYYQKSLSRLISKIKIENTPGKEFHYHSANTQLLALILIDVYQCSISELTQEKIWKRIGAAHKASWNLYEKEGIEKAFCCLNMTPMDLARFGRSIINRSSDHDQIVSDNWIDHSTKISNSNGSVWRYQWHWQVGSKEYGDFMAKGLYDQYLYIMPGKEIIIVMINDIHRPKVKWPDIFRQIVDQL